MAKNFERIEDGVDAEGYIIPGYSRWECERCGSEVQRYRGSNSADCYNCGAAYSISGQRYRDNWRDNPAWRDDSVSDMEGYEIGELRKEGSL